MRATHEGYLELPTLPEDARHVYIVPELANKSLLSIAQLCDAGCQVTFDNDAFSVTYNEKKVLQGKRMENTGLYQLDDEHIQQTVTESGSTTPTNNSNTAVTESSAAVPTDPSTTTVTESSSAVPTNLNNSTTTVTESSSAVPTNSNTSTTTVTESSSAVPTNSNTGTTTVTENSSAVPTNSNTSITTVTESSTAVPTTQFHYHFYQAATVTGIPTPSNLPMTTAAESASSIPTESPSNNMAAESDLVTPTIIQFTAAAASGITTSATIVKFLHAAFGYPTTKTLHRALTLGLIHGVHGLTPTLLARYPPNSVATVRGHLAQSRKNQRSTKPKPKSKPSKNTPAAANSSVQQQHTDLSASINNLAPTGTEQYNIFHLDDGDDTVTENDDDLDAVTTTNQLESHYCYSTTHEVTDRTYSDQTGKFVIESSQGNNYLFVLYDQATNSIMAEPIPNRQDKTITAAFIKLHDQLIQAGSKPRLHIVDNECGKIMKAAFLERKLNYQLVPPGVHRRNAAERAIRTWKDHFIAILSGTDPDFPLHLWDKLIPQVNMTLNLVRQSRINANQSAYSQINGPYVYDRTPIAPLGSKVLVHIKPHERTTWSPHAEDAYYIGPAMQHYRCYSCYMTDTQDYRISDTVSWTPSAILAPTATSTDIIVNAITELTHALQNPTPGAAQVPYDQSNIAALRQLAQLYGVQQPTEPAETAGEMRVVDNNSTINQVTDKPAAAGELRVDTPIYDRTGTFQLPPISAPPQKPTSKRPDATQVVDTYKNSTGPEGKRRRKEKRRTRLPKKLREQHATSACCSIADEDEWIAIAEQLDYALHGHAINPDTGAIAEYAELSRSSFGPQWIEAMADEVGRLMEGHQTMKTGTKTMRWIKYFEIPKTHKATYCRIVCADRPEKEKRWRVRLTVGGDRLEFSGNASTKTADLTTVKLLLNSTISTPNARWATIDIKDFYLNTIMRWEDRCYMRIPVSAVPPSILEHYKLAGFVHNGYLYVEITKGMYRLKQAGRLANEQLTEHLAKYGYKPCNVTAGLWTHETRPITFTLVVDDFGIKYVNKDDLDHLQAALEDKYKISIDLEGTKYCGMAIQWDYINGTCDISMPGYVERALARFEHPTPTRPQHAPHPWTTPDYGTRVQLTAAPDTSAPLGKADTKRIQEILGTLLYYARAIDSTMLTAIGSLSSEQAKGTEHTMKKITHLLNYCATHPEATIRFKRSDMILHVESDASYLSESRARSRAAGYFYLSRAPNSPNQAPAPTDTAPPINGAITVLSTIMREVLTSAAEAELAALYYNAKETIALRNALTEMGHPQPATPIVTDNSTAAGIVNDTVRQRRSKAIDMRFYWVRDRSRTQDIVVYWKRGSTNRADYFSKHHPGSHHTDIRPMYIHNNTTTEHVANMAHMYISHHTPDFVDHDHDDRYHACLSCADFVTQVTHGEPM